MIRTLSFNIKETGERPYVKQFNTDKSIEWTIREYSRNRKVEFMNLVV